MPAYCSNCATALDPDSRFCPSCRAPVGVSQALRDEIRHGIASGVHSFVSEASQTVPGQIWVAAVQTFWWLEGLVTLLVGSVILMAGLGASGIVAGLSGGSLGQGPTTERILLSTFAALLQGALSLGLSTVLIYGLLTSRNWTLGVFKVWLVLNLALSAIAYLLLPSSDTSKQLPFFYVFLILLVLAIRFGAMAVQFVLLKRSQSEAATT